MPQNLAISAADLRLLARHFRFFATDWTQKTAAVLEAGPSDDAFADLDRYAFSFFEDGSDLNNIPEIFAIASLIDYAAILTEHHPKLSKRLPSIIAEIQHRYRGLFSEHREQLFDAPSDPSFTEAEQTIIRATLDALL